MKLKVQECCGNCDAFIRNPDMQVKPGVPHQGWCRAKPPVLVQVMVPVKSPLDPKGQQMAPGFQGMFPPTTTHVWCREWKAEAEVIEHEQQPASTPANAA